jgi:hypothetical protein
MKTTMYNLKLNETISMDSVEIRKVPGGWIYTTFSIEGSATSTFVPFNNEFQEVNKQ